MNHAERRTLSPDHAVVNVYTQRFRPGVLCFELWLRRLF